MGSRFNNTEEAGISAVHSIVTQEFGWIFREKTKRDIGIDAEAETKDEGLLIQIQIKTGLSNFKVLKGNAKGLTYYADSYHYNYWNNLKAPILFVAYIPERKKAYWQIVSKETMIKSSKNSWKLFIPYENELTENYKETILDLLVEIKPPKEYIVTSDNDDGSVKVSGIIDLGRLRKIGRYDEHGRIIIDNPTIISIMDSVLAKAKGHAQLTQLQQACLLNPMDYKLRLSIVIKHIEVGDVTGAYRELSALIYVLSKLKGMQNMVLLKWAKFYRMLLDKSVENFIVELRKARPVLFIRTLLIGENTYLLKISDMTAYLGENEYKLDQYSHDISMFPIDTSINQIENAPLSIQPTILMEANTDGLSPSFSGFSVSKWLGIYYDGVLLDEFSENIM